MINSPERIGNFTSSEIAALMTRDKSGKNFGAPALTYIAEKNMERLLERSIDTEANARSLSWGNCLEPRVFDLLGLEYTYSSKLTDVHPKYDYWAGSKDGTKEGKRRKIIEIKCPLTLKSFIGLVLPSYIMDGNAAIDAVRNAFEVKGIAFPKHKAAEDYYWQIVSNACIYEAITGEPINEAELIVYMPYQSELLEIKNLADGNPAMYWMNFADENEIPYLPDNGRFKNLNIISFEIPQVDKDRLTESVNKAAEMLIPRHPSLLLASGDSINGQDVVIVDGVER